MHFRLSMLQVLKLVFACAVASACMAPFSRLVQLGVAKAGDAAIMDAFLVPMVLALLCFVMVRRGPARSLMVVGLVLCSTLVAFGSLTYLYGPLAARFLRYGPVVFGPIDLPGLAIAFLIIPALGGLAALLGLRMVWLLGIKTRG